MFPCALRYTPYVTRFPLRGDGCRLQREFAYESSTRTLMWGRHLTTLTMVRARDLLLALFQHQPRLWIASERLNLCVAAAIMKRE